MSTLTRTVNPFSKRRKVKGQSLLECLVSIAILVPVLLFFVNIGVLVFSMNENSAICREAARAASQVVPEQSAGRSSQIVQLANRKLPFAAVTIKCVKSDAKRPGVEGGIVAGNVSVTTVAKVKPLVSCYFLNAWLPQTFEATETFPYTIVIPQHLATEQIQ